MMGKWNMMGVSGGCAVKRLVAALLLVMLLPSVQLRAQSAKEIVGYLEKRGELVRVEPDSIFNTIREMERMVEGAGDSVTWAMLNECLGTLYLWGTYSLVQHDNYGEQLEEWGQTQWREAAIVHRNLARKPILALRAAKAEDWRPLLVMGKGEDGDIKYDRFFGGDLLHYLYSSYVTADICDFYSKQVGGEAGIMARLLRLKRSKGKNELTTHESRQYMKEQYREILGEAESDPTVSDAARVHVYECLLEQCGDNSDSIAAICNECIAKYPAEALTNNLRNKLHSMSLPTFATRMQNILYPDSTFPLRISYRNLKSIDISFAGKTTQHKPLHKKAYREYCDTLYFKAPHKPGRYKLKLDVRDDNEPGVYERDGRYEQTESSCIYVSPYTMIGFDMLDSDPMIYVVDAMSGKRDSTRQLVFYDSLRYGTKERYVRIKGDPQPAVQLDQVWGWIRDKDVNKRVSLFTDRAIYRPGQTVQMSAIAYKQRHWDMQADSLRELVFCVRDDNYEKVFVDTVYTDGYGTASCSFRLPENAGLGHYSVHAGISACSFRVEEYKRPTFEIVFGDTLVFNADSTQATAGFTARMYNGMPLRNARVSASVSTGSYWRDRYETVELDSIVTDDQGCGSLVVPLAKAKREGRAGVPLFVSVDLKVSAINGETVTGSHSYRCNDWGRNGTDVDELHDDIWFECTEGRTIYPDSAVTITVHNSLGEIYLYYAVRRNDRCIASEERLVRDSTATLTFDYGWLRGVDCDGISVALGVVKNGSFYGDSFILKRPEPESRLEWQWETFRDLVTPGNDEEWTGILLRPDGLPADASAMFTIYDASLDYFVRHNWHFGVYYPYNIERMSIRRYSTLHSERFYVDWRTNLLDVPTMLRYEWNEALRDLMRHTRELRMYRSNLCYAAPQMEENVGESFFDRLESSVKGKATDDAVEVEAEDDAAGGSGTAEDAGFKAVPMRTNFEETAYFVSSLRTDSTGRLKLRFTLPDCVTSWQLFGVAHTRDMMTANISALTVARKELMAMIDLPRFVRQGDKASGSVNVQNVSGKPQEVSLRIELIDSETEKTVQSLDHKLALVNDTVIPFSFDANRPSLIVKAVAISGNNSDGEQRPITMIYDGEWVAKSTDLLCHGKGLHSFSIDTLFNKKSRDSRISVQYTQDPIWTAVDVLKNIKIPQHDDVISLHTALYANTLLKHICDNNEDVFNHLNFNRDTLQANVNSLGKRLAALANSDGGYGWFKGFSSSQWMTLEVATTFARLKTMIDKHEFRGIAREVKVDEAVSYLRKEMHEHVKFMRKHNIKSASALDLQHLYVMALLYEDLNSDERYLLKLLLDERKHMSREQLAITTVTLSALGRRYAEEADSTCRMLRGYIVRNDRQGAFFSYLRGSFTCIDRKLLDHVFAMEAVTAMASDSADFALLGDMRRWLLQQKRVQAWENPLHNASSVYALLLGNSYSLDAQPTDTLTLGKGITLPVTDGQLKETLLKQLPVGALWTGGERPTTVSVSKHGDNDSWGAVYVESFLPLDEIKPSEQGLAIRASVEAADRQIHKPYRARGRKTKSQTPRKLSESNAALGASVQTRLVITADRDYECVHITLPRAACLEPANVLSGCHYESGLSYYQEVHDTHDDIFIQHLPKGNYVITIPAYAVHTGTYNTGVTKIECLYAPEFCGNTGNAKITVK